ncbi:MAG: chorismate synthase [Alphaproteobacteria bacterium]|nr:chorismate synthase [Alphaproteobacteria bacterium]MBF0251709.1 chorismate synthase [Alphaproteobacteria bacterium]
MPGNTFGTLLTLTTFGESHGPAIGGVVDGCPPGIALSEADIQPYLDKRRPGQSKYTTQRQEADRVRILSGVFEGVTTGTPIGLLIENTDQRSKDYGDIKDTFRPGHADFTYFTKYGLRDYRGGGRASARETAVRVAGGAVARKILEKLVGKRLKIQGAMVQMGLHAIDRRRWKWKTIDANPFFCPDAIAAEDWARELDTVRKSGSSIGGVVEVIASGVPAGLGEPVFDRMDADVAKALMSIPAVKGVEIGAGFAAAQLCGEDNADEIRIGTRGKPEFLSNNAGGTLGGITTGQDLVARIAVKPTSSILTPRRSITTTGQETDVSTKGRHDPCVAIRAVPVAEAMLALTLADHLLRFRAQCG